MEASRGIVMGVPPPQPTLVQRLTGMGAWELMAFVTLGAIWGSAFLFIKVADRHFPPFSLVMLRLAVGGLLMLFMTTMAAYYSPRLRSHMKERLFDMSTVFQLFFMGLFNNAIPFTLVAQAEQTINSGVASVLDSTIPLFSAVIAPFFLRGEQVTIHRIGGLAIGFAGVVVVSLRKMAEGREPSLADVDGYTMVTLAAASYAVASVFGRRFLTQLDPLPAATGQIIAGCMIVTMGALAFDYPNPPAKFESHWNFMKTAPSEGYLSILYLGIASTMVAYLLFFYLLRTIGSVRQTMVGFLLPFFGIIEGVIFLGEWAGVSHLQRFVEVLGAFMIMAGITVVNRKPPALEEDLVYGEEESAGEDAQLLDEEDAEVGIELS